MRNDRPLRYDDPCGIARALTVVGERWALLVVRELTFGPKRFADLRRGLGTISPNVLSQRLAELTADGVVSRRAMGPPVGAQVYELTESGRRLLPVLESLAAWGKQQPVRSSRPLSRDALMLAMCSTLKPDAPATAVRVLLDGTAWDATVERGALGWAAPAPERDLPTLEVDSAVLRALVFGDVDLDAALLDGRAHVSGDVEAIRGFLASFERPESHAG